MNSPITLERESYLIDNSHPCEIKMNATVGLVTDAVDPASAKWEVENPEICEVRDGVIYALKDGTTKITGTLSNFSDEITVTVENPQASAMPVFTEIVPGDWSLMQSGGSGLTLTPDGDGFVLSYTGASSRAPYIQATHSAQIWGLPDKIRARLNVGEAPTHMTPQTGDVAYYIPWGNLAVFVRNFRASESLVPLGRMSEEAWRALQSSGDESVRFRLRQ